MLVKFEISTRCKLHEPLIWTSLLVRVILTGLKSKGRAFVRIVLFFKCIFFDVLNMKRKVWFEDKVLKELLYTFSTLQIFGHKPRLSPIDLNSVKMSEYPVLFWVCLCCFLTIIVIFPSTFVSQMTKYKMGRRLGCLYRSNTHTHTHTGIRNAINSSPVTIQNINTSVR